MALTLVIANRNYSSCSMRPWVLLRQFAIPFNEVMLKFGSDKWARDIARYSPSQLVPVLWDGAPGEAQSTCIWDTLAIVEYVAEYAAERFPDLARGPQGARPRALDRRRDALGISPSARRDADEHPQSASRQGPDTRSRERHYAYRNNLARNEARVCRQQR